MNAKRLCLIMAIFAQILVVSASADPASVPHTVALLDDPTLSVRLLYRSPASLADENFLSIEFNNRSGTTLSVDQAFLQLDADRFDAVSGKAVSTGGVAGGVLYIGPLKPGLTQMSGYVCENASEGLGLPPRGGYSIEMAAHLDVRLKDRRDFSTPSQGVKFRLEWKYPSSAEIESATRRLRNLLAHPEHTDEHSAQLGALIIIPEAANSLTVEDLLSALSNRTDSVDGRNLVVWLLGRNFPSNPKLVAYYFTQLSAGNSRAFFDVESSSIWDRSWVQPLVANFEKTGSPDVLRALALHRPDWADNPNKISSLSSALLRFRPVLSKQTTALDGAQLNQWRRASVEAGIVGDKSLIQMLKPALDDKRVVLYSPLSQTIEAPKERVCDWAATAILTILDGSPASVFKDAGVEAWGTNDQARFDEFDRVVAVTKSRFK